MKKGWEKKEIEEISTVINGYSFSSKDFSTLNEVKSIKITNVGIMEFVSDSTNNLPASYLEEYSKVKVQKGNLVLALTRTIISGGLKVARVPESYHNSLLNQRVAAIVPLTDLVNSSYLYYYFSSDLVYNYVLDNVNTLMQPNLSVNDLKKMPVPIPPLAEQKQIVAKLDKAFEAIDKAVANTKQNIANAKELFQSRLDEIFKKGDGWEEKTLGDIGKVSMCKRILKKQTTPQGDIPFYKIGTFGKIPNAFIPKEIYEEYRSKYSFPKKGDILISASGTIGRRVIYDGLPAYFQDSNIVWIENNQENVTNDYLYKFYGYCDWNPSRGATISRLYNDDLRKIKISFPTDNKAQNKIVKELDKLQESTDKLVAGYEKKLSDLEELRKSLLEQAFLGNLT